MANKIKIKQIDEVDLTAFINEVLDGTGTVYTANRALVTDSLGDVVVSAVTSTELGYVSGVTSAIQTQLNAKQATITGGATTIVSSDLTASKALVSDGSGKVAVSSVTDTELGYVSGVTSAIQTQLDAKQATITGGATTIVSSDLTASKALVSDGSGKVAVSSVTDTELGYVSGVTSAIQTQLDAKQATITGGATTIVSSDLTASKALVSDGSGKVAVSSVTSTELGYVSGVTSAIQTQISAKFTLPSLTSGSVLFSNGATISQSNANFFWDSSNNRLGIGINSALVSKIHVVINTSTVIGQIIKAASSQSADLTQWQNSSATVLAKVNASGEIISSSNLYAGFGAGANSIVQVGFNNASYNSIYLQHVYVGYGSSSNYGAIGMAGSGALIYISSGVTVNASGTAVIAGTAYAGYFSRTGASTTNVGIYATASGATNNYAAIFDAGRVGIGTSSPGSQLQVTCGASGTIGQIIKAAASQTANLTEWQNSSSTVLSSVSSAGVLTAASIISNAAIRLKGYTVAGLPAGTQGDMAYATDLLTPTFLAAAVGGGAVVGPVFYNGSSWVTF